MSLATQIKKARKNVFVIHRAIGEGIYNKCVRKTGAKIGMGDLTGLPTL